MWVPIQAMFMVTSDSVNLVDLYGKSPMTGVKVVVIFLYNSFPQVVHTLVRGQQSSKNEQCFTGVVVYLIRGKD